LAHQPNSSRAHRRPQSLQILDHFQDFHVRLKLQAGTGDEFLDIILRAPEPKEQASQDIDPHFDISRGASAHWIMPRAASL